jgi:REP element-mobilizing transposase RayT
MIHLVFSTKNREPFINQTIQDRLHGYILGILSQMKCPSIQTGGVADHVHILFVLGRTTTQAEVVEEVKKSLSKWMKADGGVPNFSWQKGYGVFPVSESHREKVIDYIKNQEEHHRTITFQEEYRKLLEKYRIPFDEKYVWD